LKRETSAQSRWVRLGQAERRDEKKGGGGGETWNGPLEELRGRIDKELNRGKPWEGNFRES
jgi:hypothetical protein